MRCLFSVRSLVVLLFLLPTGLPAQENGSRAPADRLREALLRVMDIIEPTNHGPSPTFTTGLRVIAAEGLPKEVTGRSARLAWQAPDHLNLSVELEGDTWSLGREGEELWAHVASKKFGVVGRPDLPRFQSAPEKKDRTRLGPFRLPLQREQVLLLPVLMKTEALPDETIEGVRCRVLQASALPEVRQFLNVPQGQWQLAVRESDALPMRISYREPGKFGLVLQFEKPAQGEPVPDSRWKIPAREGDRIETTALSHLVRFFPAALAQLTSKIPALPPADGERRLVATEGNGRLEMIDHTRVLFLKGTPEEMGRQQGVLLKRQIRNLVDRILYGVGVGSSFAKGRWFFGEIEEAQGRLRPFIDARFLREMDAMAQAAGMEKEEVRLANFFPELFHCSGFALAGEATVGGHLYHGRILDYLRGLGLEQNAVVMVVQPDQGHAWVNVGYAGFVGSVTAMNEKKVAIGEMGGRGEGTLGRQAHGPVGPRGHGESGHPRRGDRDHAQRPPHLRVLLRHFGRQERAGRRHCGHRRTNSRSSGRARAIRGCPMPFKDAVLMSAGRPLRGAGGAGAGGLRQV